MGLITIKIFLAASSELANDRRQFEMFISRENQALVKRDIFLELVLWEDFIESMSRTRLQDEYNNAISRSDIFIMLFGSKVGKYALQEFETASSEYKKSGRPYTYIYFKDEPINVNTFGEEDFLNLQTFKETLKASGHFFTTYTSIDDLKYKFRVQLDRLLDYFIANAQETKPEQKGTEIRKRSVFISYSHRDNEYLERLLVHLKPLVKNGIIDLWVDTKLIAGEKWQIKIEEALKSASVAILLISADFLASDFIVDNELPPLLKRADTDGTNVIPVIIKPCRFSRHETLSIYQAINPPDKPLMGLTEFEKENYYDKIAERVEVFTKSK